MKIDKLHITLNEKPLVNIEFDILSSLALVGQSGSSKSLTLKALLGMLPKSMKLELDHSSEYELKVGESLSFVPQNPFTALSPLTKIKDQFFVDEKKSQKTFFSSWTKRRAVAEIFSRTLRWSTSACDYSDGTGI